MRSDLQEGGGLRHGDHLPPHKYIKNTSPCGTTPTEHLLNAGRRPQTSQNVRKSPHTWVGKKKKRKNRDKRIGSGPPPLGRSCEEEKFPHPREFLYWQGRGVGGGEASEPQKKAQQQGCRGQSGKIPSQRMDADQHSPAWEACLLTRRGGWGLGAEAQASEVKPQGEDWGWLREHSLKGSNVP